MNSERYKVTLAWGLKNSHILSDATKLEITRYMPYTTNPQYILANAYREMIATHDIVKDLSEIPNLDDIYLINWEIVYDDEI